MRKAIKFLLYSVIFILIFSFMASGGIAAEPSKAVGKKVAKSKDKTKTAPKAETKPPETGVQKKEDVSRESAAETPQKAFDPKDRRNLIYLDTKGDLAGTGDIKKSGIASKFAKIGAGWHPTALAETGLPADKYGLIDWAKIVKDKLIDPNWNFDPNAKPDDEEFFDVKILFETKSDFMDNVVFPHDIHTWWLKCEVCHSTVGGAIFEPSAGANEVLMSEMVGGKWCGRCHNKIAFPLADCKRCHIRAKNLEPDDSLTLRAVNK